MPSVFDEVLAWATTRPWWQQQALARIAGGESLQPTDIQAIASSLFQPPPSPPVGGWFAGLAAPAATTLEPVRILAVRGVTNVNQLAHGQELTFAPDGLTVVYGNNGSGKSGYARVIQSMVRTRYRADILSDVFADTPGAQTGEVLFRVGAQDLSAALGGPSQADLGRVAFYDEHCGDTYLDTEAEISYRPSAIQLLDDLTHVCNGVRSVIDGWRREHSTQGDLPDVHDSGSSAIFLRILTKDTTDEQIRAATACPGDAERRLDRQVDEVARLRTSDPTREKRAHERTADALSVVSQHLEALDQSLGADIEDRLRGHTQKMEEAQEAAEAASELSFAGESLPGVGTTTWQVLWRAAEAFSSLAYPDSDFPHTGDQAVCLLCQQPLGSDAQARLDRFHAFVTDTTAGAAKAATETVAGFKRTLRAVNVIPQAVMTAIATVEQADEGFASSVQPLLDGFSRRQAALVEGAAATPVDVTATVARLDSWAATLRLQAEAIDAQRFAEQLAQAEAEEHRLRDQLAMRDGRALIEAERSRLRVLDTLNAKYSEGNTRSITDKVGDLTRTYVTEEARDRFTRETDRLGLERVTFRATKARQGVLLHKTDFLNARAGTRLGDVLSEGEQTALGFAGFLTEAHFEPSKSALVFDDPVSSLDHMKREAVAARIVALAEDHQVIVFTHDVAFTMALRKAAGEADVAVTTRGVERKRKVGPGFTTTTHPWTAQDAPQRLDTLRQEVAALRRSEQGMSETDYLARTEQIAGHMSETWERVISQVLAEPLVDYRSLEVRVGKLRIVGRVSEEDVKTYDDSYSRISGWASRHDRHPELNYCPPTVETLDAEIAVLDTWFRKVKKYQA